MGLGVHVDREIITKGVADLNASRNNVSRLKLPLKLRLGPIDASAEIVEIEHPVIGAGRDL